MSNASHDPIPRKLEERVKELTALHKTARLLQDVNRPSDEIVRGIVALLPQAWQYPDVTAARIQFGEIEKWSPGFRTTSWMQKAEFAGRRGDEGSIEIVYLEERPAEQEGPFLSEERDLIESLADMLQSYFQHKTAEQEVQASHDNLERLVQQRTEELLRTNRKLEQEIPEHQSTRLELDQYQARLRQLATELSLAEARQRREFAVDLHDHVIQEFAFIKMRILQFRGDAVFCGFERNFEEIIALLERAIQYTRQLTFQISTPILYELGLAAALEWLAEQFTKRHPIRISAELQPIPKSLPEAIRVTLFKCVQELLTNVVKYSQAKTAKLRLQINEGGIIIDVEDDGIGFEVSRIEAAATEQTGFGLFSIRERLRYFGGEIQVHSAVGQGTRIRLTIPMEI